MIKDKKLNKKNFKLDNKSFQSIISKHNNKKNINKNSLSNKEKELRELLDEEIPSNIVDEYEYEKNMEDECEKRLKDYFLFIYKIIDKTE